ncbi:hypothetical protein NEUTE1DRAFT_35581 [Neurospora tetrasperma FGSC 2508]|uniref:Uncharacterized protein n=1 Tax=Neurospora tetrasperma (strain FGSC 2508 / ATCC MYA-4615 / P0657) TaxID=510951 RepID=F8MEQ9_NEUT8|nr:uncharacterized protein NEUTE1DRAFT_35581 [Neurospora tetrasperma FGSC 2508]EGO61688.1 hypothetical protein NEUTE1DRAFT_35581 [Neurospora tetrasperma FGSC 2508]EGZ74258.1 hypothetical protein NEUTE2DRAFT_57024 [Neurospora tetrasperma FGSC 2509]
MRTTCIATVLLALAPTAIFGSPVPVLKVGVTTSDHHDLTGSKTTKLNHGIVDRDDHNPPTKTAVPGDLCINAHATMICTPGGEGKPNWNQNTKFSKPDDSYQCTGGPDNETCIFDDGRKVSCTSNQKTAALQTNARNGEGPDFTCVTDTRGVCVCTGADLRCIIEKQGDATCSFNGSDGDASKLKVNTERLATVLSTVAPKPKDDSDPFDANPNYSCSQISDWTWSCGSNGADPGNPSGNSLVSDGGHYDPGQGCNQPQGFFGGCDGKLDSHDKIEGDHVPKANAIGSDVTCVDMTDRNKLPYPSGLNDCSALQSDFLSPNNTLFNPDPDVNPHSTNPDDFVLSWSTDSKTCKHAAHNTCHLSICNYAIMAGATVPVKIPKAVIRENMKMVLDKCVEQQQVGGYVYPETTHDVTLALGTLDTTQTYGKRDVATNDGNPDEDCSVVESFFWYCKAR